MKKALFTLIAVIVLVVVVLPLIYISLGKLRNPVDTISSNVAKQTFANQNYIPDAADTQDPNAQNPNDFNLELEKKCLATSTTMQVGDFTSTSGTKGFMASSTVYNFTWQLPGLWEIPNDPSSAKSISNGYALFLAGTSVPGQLEKYLTLGLKAIKYKDPACTIYYNKMFAYYHDSGRYLTDYNWDSVGLELREKGLINISGVQYYWYGFDDTKNPGVDATSGPAYYVEFNAFKNGIAYQIGFKGYKNSNKSYRNIVNVSTQYLGGLILK